jgi:hypothetical protein
MQQSYENRHRQNKHYEPDVHDEETHVYVRVSNQRRRKTPLAVGSRPRSEPQIHMKRQRVKQAKHNDARQRGSDDT